MVGREELSKGARTLNEAAVREFLVREYPRIVMLVAIACESRPAAEDAVQEALARAWERSVRGERIDSLPAWVMTVSLNLARSRFRRLVAERRAVRRLAGVDRHHEAPPEEALDLARALGALPRRQRMVVVLRYYADLDIREIASTLKISPGTVKSTLHRARKTLAAALGPTEEEERVAER